MSDGNFNRALLPSTPYRSGVRMGQQQTKAKAVSVLRLALDSVEPPLSVEQKEAVVQYFEREL
ncbi:MAG: hypothetical protein IKP36_01380 [Bacteroidaceae bacterium]|jgi:hypothetical protein|nr:hypothetical protein [Bacteroidaceae bacterium]